MSEFTQFDLLNSPLAGTNLIEASAGTGKTFTITGLFLRLILEKGLSVREILVVTFTEAATEELKDRIRSGLRKTLQAFVEGGSDDPFLKGLVEGNSDPEGAGARLREAIYEFDTAAIFTIHGFCRRMLREKAFESGSLFDTELVTDQQETRREVIEDFWRRQCYGADPLFVRYAVGNGFLPEELLRLLGGWISVPFVRIIPEAARADSRREESEFLEAFEGLRGAWPEARDEVARILTESGALHRGRYPRDRIPGWIEAMDSLTEAGADPFLFKGFEKFTSGVIGKALKKGQMAPSHPFFDCCERLSLAGKRLDEAFRLRLLYLKRALFEEAGAEVDRRKRERNVQSFDDLLLDLFHALLGEGGEGLAGAVRRTYRAALIDEFQDTDPIQYDIFRRIFGEGEGILFLIGDPKQAIYSFRGADVFAYMQAAADAGTRYTLKENWRSEPGLIEAVNTVFSFRDLPFLYDAIPFHPVTPAAGREHEYLEIDGKREASLHLWFAGSPESAEPGKAVPKGEAREIAAAAVAAEISRLLLLAGEGSARIGGRSLREGDMAVLVRTNAEARLVQGALSALRIRSVLYVTGNLFDSHEAAEAERVLAAVMEPGRESLVRAALATDMMGIKGEELEALGRDENAWEGWLLRFRDHHDQWRERGFIRMFRRLLFLEGVLPRLMSLPGGERRNTNILHLSEVLHRKALERGLNMAGLLKWLSEQRRGKGPGQEEHPLRLESDGNSVRVVTIHRSKGLEYPVVFCPFLWEGSTQGRGREPASFHDEENRMRLTLDLGSGDMEKNQGLGERERLAENIRLFYVALTRARNRCYMVWGRFRDAETSAPAYLLYPPGGKGGTEGVREAGRRFNSLEDKDLIRGLEILQKRAQGAVALPGMPEGRGRAVPETPSRAPVSACRTFSGSIDSMWRISSFSSLTSGPVHASESPDRDRFEARGEGPSEEGKGMDIFSFPRGTRAGTMLHEIFEHLDFQEEDPSEVMLLVTDRLRAHGFDPSWGETVLQMVGRVLSAPLDPGRPGFHLSRIPGGRRLNELEFLFPLRTVTPEGLRRVFQDHGVPGAAGEIPESLEGLEFSPQKGFMKGFMDLVFEWEGRFHLVDWKSNFLGPRVEDYGQRGLAEAMVRGFYTLQYHIYTVALDRYLALRLPGYDYETHFGGVYYIFLRGVDPGKGPRYGIYRARPAGELVRDLCGCLIDGG